MVVFMKYEMEDDGRRGKRVGLFRRMFGSSGWSTTSSESYRQSTSSLGPVSPPRERRPLRSVPTIGPQYKVDPEVLAKEYVEKETKYMGTVTDVKSDFDVGNRAMILSVIDEKRKVGLLPSHMSWDRDVVLSFSVYNVKIFWRDGEELVHRIPTHQIASVGYVQDDNQTILFFKFASELGNQMCNLALFCCESKLLAQEICYLTQQLFQLAYTNSTMDFFDKSIQDGAVTPKNHSYSTDDSAEKKNTVKLTPFIEQDESTNHSNGFPAITLKKTGPAITRASTLPYPTSITSPHKKGLVHHSSNGGMHSISPSSTPSSPVATRKPWRSESSTGSASTNSIHPQLQLNEYIEVLKERLNAEELRMFAHHLHHFRNGSVPIDVFCNQLIEIYTEQRKSLLLGMRHFIPNTKDRLYFEKFLHKHDVETTSDEARWWDKAPKSRTVSETEESNASTTIHINELSSNSDHISASPASNEDSGEWKSMIVNFDAVKINEESATLKRENSCSSDADSKCPSTPVLAKQFDSSQTSDTLEVPTDQSQVMVSVEEGDSPLLRSGQEIPEIHQPVFVRHREETKQKKKKSRGKSPSTVELGAPFPSIATGGTDDDLKSSQDKKFKRGLRNKRKDKSASMSASESATKTKLVKSQTFEATRASTTSLTMSSSEEVASTEGKKRLFKSKKDTSDALSASTLTLTNEEVANRPPKSREHRKKKKHKTADDESNVGTFL